LFDEKRTLLHVGCGGAAIPEEWAADFREVRLDIDPSVKPDIVADMVNIPASDESFDCIFSSHNLEHLSPHDVIPCLQGFYRVLKPMGAAIILVPDLEDVRPTDEVLFVSPAGPISGLDMYYGFRPALKEHPYMAHKTGFVQKTLDAVLRAAGFQTVNVVRLSGHLKYNLISFAIKGETNGSQVGADRGRVADSSSIAGSD
jgi:ubiquinone/menaquinone biosynthesis C-methylase UbiE